MDQELQQAASRHCCIMPLCLPTSFYRRDICLDLSCVQVWCQIRKSCLF